MIAIAAVIFVIHLFAVFVDDADTRSALLSLVIILLWIAFFLK